MSQYLDKEKLLKWLHDTKVWMTWDDYIDVKNKIESGTFDNYAAHNAVALLDDLEIKLNEANRQIEKLEAEHSSMKMALEWINDYRETLPASAETYQFADAFLMAEDKASYVLSTLSKKDHL